MLALHLTNIIIFFRQYLAATVLAIVVYLVLTRLMRKFFLSRPIFRLNLGSSSFFSYKTSQTKMPDILILLPGEDLSTKFTSLMARPLFFSLEYYHVQNGYPGSFYSKLSTELRASKPYLNNLSYITYKIFFTVAVWEGLLLLFTPFKYLGVFIPHISTDVDIIIGLVIGISIFESSISTIFLFSGTRMRNILMVMGLVVLVYSISYLTPSMSWLSLYNQAGKITYFSVILSLVLAITVLIPQLKTKRNLYLSAYSFSIISYLAFIFTIIVNLIH